MHQKRWAALLLDALVLASLHALLVLGFGALTWAAKRKAGNDTRKPVAPSQSQQCGQLRLVTLNGETRNSGRTTRNAN